MTCKHRMSLKAKTAMPKSLYVRISDWLRPHAHTNDSRGLFDLEFCNNRKVIRSDQRVVAALDAEPFQGQMAVVIEMVQVQERKKPRIGTRVAGEGARIESFEHFAHEA